MLLKAVSWAVFRNAETYDSFPILSVQLATLAILLIACFIAAKGINPLKRLLTAAGTCTFVMSILYIVMMFAAPYIHPDAEYVNTPVTLKSLIPDFNFCPTLRHCPSSCLRWADVKKCLPMSTSWRIRAKVFPKE